MSELPGAETSNKDGLEEHPYDHELDISGLDIKASDLAAVGTRILSEWLNYVNGEPPLHELKANAFPIMESISAALGVPGNEALAMELAAAVDLKFEQMGLWRAWYGRLMELYAPATTSVPQRTTIKLYRCFINYYLHRGDLKRASGTISSLLDLAALEADDSLQDAMLGAATVAATLEASDEGATQAEQLIELAALTDNKILLGRSYTVLAQFSANRLDGHNTFMYGQMVYSVGLGVGSAKFIPAGLHYMALAFQISRQPQQAFHYLKLAIAAAHDAHDESLQEYMLLTWGMCTYLERNYVEAETRLAHSVEAFDGPGSAHYYASALYAHGLTLMKLARFAESEARLTASLVAWIRLEHPYEQLYSRHGLAEVYSLSGRHHEAVTEISDTLAQAEAMGARSNPAFLQILRDDLARYKSKLEQPNKADCPGLAQVTP